MLVEVRLEVLWLYSVVSAREPRFQVAEDSMDMWGLFVCTYRRADNAHGVFVAGKRRVGVSSPAVGAYPGTWFDGAPNESADARLSRVLDDLESKSPGSLATLATIVGVSQHLDRPDNESFVLCGGNTAP